MSKLFLRAGDWHLGPLPMDSYDGADMQPIPLEIAGQWTPHFDHRNFCLGGDLAIFIQNYLGRGYELMFYGDDGPPIATERLNMTLVKGRKSADFSFAFVRDHAGRFLRVTSFSDAKKLSTLKPQPVLVAGELRLPSG